MTNRLSGFSSLQGYELATSPACSASPGSSRRCHYRHRTCGQEEIQESFEFKEKELELAQKLKEAAGTDAARQGGATALGGSLKGKGGESLRVLQKATHVAETKGAAEGPRAVVSEKWMMGRPAPGMGPVARLAARREP